MPFDTTLPFRGSDAVRRGDVSRGVLDGPRFRRIGADTYVAAPVPDSPLLQVRAALVRGGPGAVATGWSACVALGLDVARGPRPVGIAVADRRLTCGSDLLARRRQARSKAVRNAVVVTTPSRTTTSCGSNRRSGPESRAVDRVVDPLTDAVVAADALARHGEFTAEDLREFAERHRGARGVRRVPRVVALLDPRPDSPPETRARVKAVLAGLPPPRVRHEIRDELGVLRFELDLAWPDYRVALEYDGKDHALHDRRGRDIDRLDALRRLGWLVVVVTAPQLARPTWVPDRIREALVGRGWTPGPNPWATMWTENRAANDAPAWGARRW